MDLSKAKDYFALGVVGGFSAHRVPMGKGWHLVIAGRGARSGERWTLETARGELKVFSSLEALVSEVERIAGRVSSLNVTV